MYGIRPTLCAAPSRRGDHYLLVQPLVTLITGLEEAVETHAEQVSSYVFCSEIEVGDVPILVRCDACIVP